MADIIADWVLSGINYILSAVMIVVIISVLISWQDLNKEISEQQALSSEMKEYMEYNQYDSTRVYAQDIITAIFQYRGDPAIYVNSSKGTYTWTSTNAPCDYVTSEIADLIDQTVVYDATIGYGTNGEIVSFNFVTHID